MLILSELRNCCLITSVVGASVRFFKVFMTENFTSRDNSIFDFFDEQTLSKGRSYFMQSRVKSCERIGDKLVCGIVEGSQKYWVMLNFGDSQSELSSTSCECPVMTTCKHAAALAIAFVQEASNGFGPRPINQTMRNQRARQSKERRGEFEPSELLQKSLYRLSDSKWKFDGDKSVTPINPKDLQTSKTARFVIYTLKENVQSIVPIIGIHKVAALKNGAMGKPQEIDLQKFFYPQSLPDMLNIADEEISRLWRSTLADRHFFSPIAPNNLLFDEPDLLNLLLSKIIKTGRCFMDDCFETPLKLGPALPASFSWVEYEPGWQKIQLTAGSGDAVFPCWKWKTPWYYDKSSNTCGPALVPASSDMIESIWWLPPVDEADSESLQIALPDLGLDNLVPKPKCKRKIELRVVRPEMKMESKELKVLYEFPYLQNRIAKSKSKVKTLIVRSTTPDASNTKEEDGVIIKEKFDHAFEIRNLAQLDGLGFVQIPSYKVGEPEDSRVFMPARVDAWLNLFNAMETLKFRENWVINEDANIRPMELGEDQLELRVREDGNWWLSLALNIQIGKHKVPLLPILLAAIKSLPDWESYSKESIETLNRHGSFVSYLDDATPISMPFDRIRPILYALHDLLLRKRIDDISELRLSIMDLALDENADNSFWNSAESSRALLERIMQLRVPDLRLPPENLTAELRPYQQEGYSWLKRLAEQRFGGILADDMGLGKTVQMLAFICSEKELGKMTKPFLVVCPKSVLPNWLSECERFAPSLKVLALRGQDRFKNYDLIAEADIVVTNYALISADIDLLEHRGWHGIVLDEAQAIKNQGTKLAKNVSKLKADVKFCLTGTPIENNLGELWSQFNFLMPGFLGDYSFFKEAFRKAIEEEMNAEALALLSRRVKPFLLRRTKENVAQDLPGKNEMYIRVELEGLQRDLYETVRVASSKKVLEEIARKGFKQSQIVLLDALLKLRQVCCDPRLVKKLEAAKKVKETAKLDALMEMLPSLLSEGRKVLVFSQFTSMLDLIKEELDKAQIDYAELRGSTENREVPVQRFQSGEVSLFLLSLKAGGTGINLTAADTVIHYDPWWNPAVENQATDRAHRIGQDKTVFVYKLVVKGSIEEKIMERQKRKKALADSIYIDGGSSSFSLDESDIASLLSPLEFYTRDINPLEPPADELDSEFGD